MDKQQLIDWATHQLNNGYDTPDIKQALKKQGYNFITRTNIANAALKQYNAQQDQKNKQAVQREQKAAQFQIDDRLIVLGDLTTPTQGYKPQKDKPRLLDFKAKKQRKLEQKYPHRSVLARIELTNGFIRNFIVLESDGAFTYEDNIYILDNVHKRYDIDAQMWCYEFHEECALPITFLIHNENKEKEKLEKKLTFPYDKNIPIRELRNALQNTEINQIEYATNPSSLKWFMNSRIVNKILAGSDEDKMLKFIKLMTIINTAVSAFVLLAILFNFTSSATAST